MSNLLHRELAGELFTAVRGDGIYLFDAHGRRYLDAAASGGVSCLGHSDADVIAAMKRQLESLSYVNNSMFTNEPAEAAATMLAGMSPPGLDQVYFVSGGAEAVEASLKIARQYFVESGEPERRIIVSRRQSFHGHTLATVSASGDPARRALFEPWLIDVKQVSPCYAYREQADHESPQAYGERLASELERLVERFGSRSVAALIAEPVVGGTLGAVPAVPGYFLRLREICDRYGILLILDEVMCGMGKTGSLFAFEQEGVVPDIVCISKALGGGYQPIAATLVSRKIRDAIADRSGVVQHFHTYQAHPVACAAVCAVLKKISHPTMLAQVRARGDQLMALLRKSLGQHPNVGDIRGRGLFLGIEFVHDRETKGRLPVERQINAALKREAMNLGLTVTVIGAVNDCAMLSPPFIVTEEQINEIATRFSRAVESIFARPGHGHLGT